MSPHPSVFILETPSSSHFSAVLEQELLTNRKYSDLPQILITSYDELENGDSVEHKLSCDKNVLLPQVLRTDQKECKRNFTKAVISENEFSHQLVSSRYKQTASLANVWQLISGKTRKKIGTSSFSDEKDLPLLEKHKGTPKCEMRISGDCRLDVKWQRSTTLRANTVRHLQKCKNLPNVPFGAKNVPSVEEFKRNSHKKVCLSFSNSQLLRNNNSKPDNNSIRRKHKCLAVDQMANKSFYERRSTGKTSSNQTTNYTRDRLPNDNKDTPESPLEEKVKHSSSSKLPRGEDARLKTRKRISLVQEDYIVSPTIGTRTLDATDKVSTRKMKGKMDALGRLNFSEVSTANIAGTKTKPLSASSENILLSDKFNKTVTKSFSSRGKGRI